MNSSLTTILPLLLLLILPLLLPSLLYGSVDAKGDINTDLHLMCGGALPKPNVEFPTQCSSLPCYNTIKPSTLALPFILSLRNNKNYISSKVTLKLYNAENKVSELARIQKRYKNNTLMVTKGTCDDKAVTRSDILTSGDEEWCHVMVVMEEGHVRVYDYYTPLGHEHTPINITWKRNSSFVAMMGHFGSMYGLSPIKNTTTSTTTITTTTTTITPTTTTTTTTTMTTTNKKVYCIVSLSIGIPTLITVIVMVLCCIKRRSQHRSNTTQAQHNPVQVSDTLPTLPDTLYEPLDTVIPPPLPLKRVAS